MKYKVFVDGQEGTTGLQIYDRLMAREDIELLRIPEEKRKDPAERSRFLNQADIVFLCLPDDAAREAVSLIHNDHTRVIDASTAHRIAEGWVYGIPELGDHQYEAIRQAKRVAVPGCYATCFNMVMYPLVSKGIVPADYPATCHALSGYSGGGKKLIHEYETNEQKGRTPAFYALSLQHKHLPEMRKISGLDKAPVFMPIVSDYYKGMSVAVPLYRHLLNQPMSAREVGEFLAAFYQGRQFVQVYTPDVSLDQLEKGFLYADNCNDTNTIQLFVFGNEDSVLVMASLDNLGKGASGAAVQNMNIMLGVDEATGLNKL